MGSKFVKYFSAPEFYGLFRILPDEAKSWIGNMPPQAEDAAIAEMSEKLEKAKLDKGADLEPLEMKDVVVQVVKEAGTIEEICQLLGIEPPAKPQKPAPQPAVAAPDASAQPKKQAPKPQKPAPQPEPDQPPATAAPDQTAQTALDSALDNMDAKAGQPVTASAPAQPAGKSKPAPTAKASKPRKAFPLKSLLSKISLPKLGKKKDASGADPNAKPGKQAPAAQADPAAKGGKKKTNPKMFVVIGVGVLVLAVLGVVLLGGGDTSSSDGSTFVPVGPQSFDSSGNPVDNSGQPQGNTGKQNNGSQQGNTGLAGHNPKAVLVYDPNGVGPVFHRPQNMYDLFRNPDWAFILFGVLGIIGLYQVRRERLSAQALTDLGLIAISAILFTLGFYASHGIAQEIVVKSTFFSENMTPIPVSAEDLSGIVTFGFGLLALGLCGAAAISGKLNLTPVSGIFLYMGWLMTWVVSTGAMQTMGMVLVLLAAVVQFIQLLRDGRVAFSIVFIALAAVGFLALKTALLLLASKLYGDVEILPSMFVYFLATFSALVIVLMVTERFSARFVNKVKTIVPKIGKIVEIPADNCIDVTMFLTIVALIYAMVNMGHL